ncbi:RNA polymerase subunit sigma-70 [Pseudomonas lutea]|uniref:Regulator of SigK n=2 Tax=Pseudomonas lutea TaxID=243924 RepID=A0A9X0EHL7_9PSED|nr:RNA polymerase subunit sigma-70 [Pseudomonas lutea]
MTGQTEDDGMNDLDALASEYVLGTLEPGQRRDVQNRLAMDPDLRAAVDAWEERLLALTELAEPQTPSPTLWGRIERSLNHQDLRASRPAPTAQSWWNLLPLWRGLAGAGLVASLLLGMLLLNRPATEAPTTYLVVLVAPQNQAPGWVIQANNPTQIQLIPLSVSQVPADKALQFWTKADGWQGPVSLGMVEPGHTLSVPLDKLPPLQPNQLFELTLENPNGSPTGKPTGPIQFIGRAVKVI